MWHPEQWRVHRHRRHTNPLGLVTLRTNPHCFMILSCRGGHPQQQCRTSRVRRGDVRCVRHGRRTSPRHWPRCISTSSWATASLDLGEPLVRALAGAAVLALLAAAQGVWGRAHTRDVTGGRMGGWWGVGRGEAGGGGAGGAANLERRQAPWLVAWTRPQPLPRHPHRHQHWCQEQRRRSLNACNTQHGAAVREEGWQRSVQPAPCPHPRPARGPPHPREPPHSPRRAHLPSPSLASESAPSAAGAAGLEGRDTGLDADSTEPV